MFGIPSKELKQAAEQVARTLATVDQVAQDASALLREARGIAEDVHAITTALRAIITKGE